MKRTTIQDLAKILNISTSTVSRALSDHPDISKKTKYKVRAAAKEFNYTTNLHAKFFRNQRTRLIALILPEVNMFFSPNLIKGINEVISPSNYSLIIFTTNDNFEIEKEMVTQCLSWAVEGVLISLSRETKNVEHLKKLKAAEIDTIILDKTINNDAFPSVLIDSEQASFNAVTHLIQNGHKDILGVFGNPNFNISKKRMAGYYKALAEAGLPTKPTNLISLSQTSDLDFVLPGVLKHNTDITAIFTMSDELLSRTLFHVKKAEMKIPDDISIIAISDGVYPFIDYPRISHIKDSGKTMGFAACSILLDIIDNKAKPLTEHFVETQLLELDSVKNII